MLLALGVGLLISGLLYSAAAYAPITLHYDANGNLDQRIDGSGTTNYSYDALDRMGNETGPLKAQTFGYDGNGNRTSDGAGSYAYLANSNRLQTAHGQAIATDPAGNITGDGVYTYVYNQAGQLGQVKRGSSIVASYSYDYRGQRTRKQVGATTTLYHYDQSGHLIAESDTSGNILRTYVWRDDTPYAQIESSSGRDQVYYLEVDTLNTPRTARDQTGTIVWQWYSDAFGSTLPNEDPDGNGVLTHINLRFPGQYYDQETGLHYNGTRHYDPALGRYLQSDRIGLAGGVNTYAYVYNNPLKYTDPLGLIAGVDDAIEVAAVAEAAAACAANPACAAAAAEVAAEATAAGEAVGAAASALGKYCVIQLHHAWPKYLGGPAKQALVTLEKNLHDAYHSGLDKILPRQWGKSYYDNLTGPALQQVQRDLASYTQAFDAKYGTQLYEAMVKNGFLGK